MVYIPREIKDRVAVGDDIFIVEDLGNNRIRLIPAPTHVSEPGTPINKALLQPIEDELGNLSASRIMESGSNENGYYVRWENGLQVCFIPSLQVEVTAANTRINTAVTWPVSFKSGSYAISVCLVDWSRFNVFAMNYMGTPGRFATEFTLAVNATYAQTYTFEIIAVGSWK